MLDKKQIWVIFLFELKMGPKAAETTWNIKHLAQELLMNIRCSGDSRSFAKENRALKMRSIVAGHWKLTMTNWEQSLKLIPLQLFEKLPKNSVATILWSFGIWSKLERWKSLISGGFMSCPPQKILSFLKCWLPLFCATTMNHFLIGLWYVMKNRFYVTTNNNQLSGWPKKKVQSTYHSQTCTKNRSWSLFGGLQPVWSTIAFWIPLEKLLHLRWRNHYIWEVCSANRWDALKTAVSAAGIGQEKGLNFPWQCLTTHCTTNASKIDELGCEVLSDPPYSPDLLPTDYHFFKHLNNFLQGKCFNNQQEAENAFQEFVESWSMDFYATGISKLISHWQKCVDYNDSYFD